ncbi:K+-sensing histidine kinase KdpD [Flavobacteriaceae bacterium MAR_2010_72]|nr:K+-sensing histidine kinase KdpD [Flavobacteriaceae bacterium MAR_2010_72]
MDTLFSFRYCGKLSILFFIAISWFPNFSYAQEALGHPNITNYNYQDYEAGPTNWGIVEGDNGIMYFANTDGVLEFDGVNWKLITSPKLNGTRILAKDKHGTIFLTGDGEMGYLKANESGELSYVSLKDKIPLEHRELGTVWDCEVVDNTVEFRTSDKIFVWDYESMTVIVPNNPIHLGTTVNGKRYMRIWNVGLCYFDNGEFKLVPGGEQFADERIYVMLPYDDKRMLVGVRNVGFFIYDGKTFQPFKTDIDNLVKDQLYLPGLALKNGDFIINSIGGGAFRIDPNGKLIQEYTTATGLQDGSVDYVYQDSRGILWFALFNGISRVDLNAPYTFYNSKMGLETNVVFDTYKFNNILYIGTNDGVFYLEEGSKKFEKLEGTSGQAYQFEELNGRLYLASSFMGFIEIKHKSFEYVRESINYDFRTGYIFRSKIDSNRLFLFYDSGLKSFYFDNNKNQFVEESDFKITTASFPGFAELDNGDILINSAESGKIIRFYHDSKSFDLASMTISHYDTSHGLPDTHLLVLDILDTTYIIAANKSIYTFNAQTEVFEETEPFFEGIDNFSEFSYPRKDTDGKLFYSFGNGVHIVQQDGQGGYIINSETFKDLKNRSFYYLRPEAPNVDGNQVVWLSGADGVIRYEGHLNVPEATHFNVQIRSFNVAGNELVYGGWGEVPSQLEVDYKSNTVVIGYAAPLYKGQNNVEYSTFLEGFDKTWSPWTKQTSREYINLPPGKYVFKTKAKSLFGSSTNEASVEFSITTPWYLTWWAYTLYGIGLLVIVYAIVRRRTKLLRRRQKELEDNVEARTQEVQKRLGELATVNTVSRALTEKLQLSELITMVGEEMKKLFHSDITYLAILDKETNIINFPYQDGDNMQPFKYGEGLTSKIIKTGEPLLINKDEDIDAEINKMGIKHIGQRAISYLGVPIRSEDEIIGVLSVQSTQIESRFSEEDKRLLNTIAINVGIAIHNAELFEEAQDAKAKAEDANEAKSAFLSTVSHELRTPLTSVLGFAKIIRKRLEDKIFPAVTIDDQKIKRTMVQVSENLNVVVSEGERLTNLINDVLDLAKIESGKMEWNMKPIFLQDAINRAIASTQSLFDAKKIPLIKNIPSDLPLISADEDKLIQVVINLLSNAIKFTDKGKVSIDAYLEKDQIIVELQDTGIGIAEDDKHKVFERFRQAGDTLTDKPKGTGLGLPICREIIEHHGGIIWMKSELGVGSTFFFSIPALGDAIHQQPIQLERILKSLKKQIKHSSLNTNVESIPTILVVDDDTPIRSLLRQELGEAGYNVTEAANGKIALDMVRASKPDLIILDVMMPEINGFDVAAVLKNDPATMDIPIIILSIVQDKERGLRIGVDRYLTKPINTEQLFHEVDALLEQGVSKKKVLVVDEDASAVKSLSDVLSARGYKVLESNPDKLFEMASESQPDIIMLNSVYNGNPELIKDLKLQKGMENVMFFIYE